MEEARELLKKVSDAFKKPEERRLLAEIESKHKQNTGKFMCDIKSLEDSKDMYNKKNLQLEAEIRKLNYLENKKTENFQKNNDEKLKLAKRVVELESINEKNGALCKNHDLKIQELESQLKMLNKPSFNEVYLELVKGFGVDFNKNVCRIKNKKQNDIFRVEIDENASIHRICNEIWKNTM